MTYRDELNKQSSYALYHTISNFLREGGELGPYEEEMVETVGESHIDDESYKEALMDLIERLHNDDLL